VSDSTAFLISDLHDKIMFCRVDETLLDVPITIIDCNEEFVNNPEKHKEMMATVSSWLLKVGLQIYTGWA